MGKYLLQKPVKKNDWKGKDSGESPWGSNYVFSTSRFSIATCHVTGFQTHFNFPLNSINLVPVSPQFQVVLQRRQELFCREEIFHEQ
jgi:hypothetical protein